MQIPIADWLFNTALGQTIIMWSIIILAGLVIFLVVLYVWIMIKGGIPSVALLVKGDGRFGRIYKCKDTDTAIEIGNNRFLKPRVEDPTKIDEEGKPMRSEVAPPLTYWRRLKSAKLYLVAEGDPSVKSWKNLIEQSEQPTVTPQEIKNDPQVRAANTSIDTFKKGGARINLIYGLVLIGFGFMMALAFVGLGLIPFP